MTCMELLPVKFEFRNTEYEALVRIKVKETTTEYGITVMDGELEKMLYGHHIMLAENGVLGLGDVPDGDTKCLKSKIAAALLPYIGGMPVSYS